MNGTTVDAPKVEKKPAAADEKPLVGNIYLSSRNKNNGGLKYSVRVAESCNGGSTTRPLILSEGVRRPTLVNNNETVAIVLVSNENFCSSNNNTESRKSSLRKSFSYTMI